MEEKENKIRKILFNEVSCVIAIIAVILGVVNWVRSPQEELEKKFNVLETNQQLIKKDIENLTGNHLIHIQESIVELKQEFKEVKNCTLENQKNIVKILTILEKDK